MFTKVFKNFRMRQMFRVSILIKDDDGQSVGWWLAWSKVSTTNIITE